MSTGSFNEYIAAKLWKYSYSLYTKYWIKPWVTEKCRTLQMCICAWVKYHVPLLVNYLWYFPLWLHLHCEFAQWIKHIYFTGWNTNLFFTWKSWYFTGIYVIMPFINGSVVFRHSNSGFRYKSFISFSLIAGHLGLDRMVV